MQRKGREFCDEIWETIDVILDELDDERDTYDRHGDHIVNSLPEPIKTKIKGLVSGFYYDFRLFLLNTDWCEPLYVMTRNGLKYRFDKTKFINYVKREFNDYMYTNRDIVEDELDRFFHKEYLPEDIEDKAKQIANVLMNLFVEIEDEELEKLRRELGSSRYERIVSKAIEYTMNKFNEIPKKYINKFLEYLGIGEVI